MKNLIERNADFLTLRNQLLAHPLYKAIKNSEDIKTFMSFHVFAVWDFMSLLKFLQKELTCTEVPWFPKGNAETRYLINEIVCGEESDIDPEGKRTSHFELYMRAMKDAGASSEKILQLIDALNHGKDIQSALKELNIPEGVVAFVQNTFDLIATDKPHLCAAVFTYGREDLIPEMFLKIVKELESHESGELSTFRYYLERHIEVDGGHHGALAVQMTNELCGDDANKWEEAAKAVCRALQMRIGMWDEIYSAVKQGVDLKISSTQSA